MARNTTASSDADRPLVETVDYDDAMAAFIGDAVHASMCEMDDKVRPGATLVAGDKQARATVRIVAVDGDRQVHFEIL